MRRVGEKIIHFTQIACKRINRMIQLSFFTFLAQKVMQRNICGRRGDSFVCSKDCKICSIHFVGGNGPTKENPDPMSQWRSQPDGLVMLCKFKSSFISLEIDSVYDL